MPHSTANDFIAHCETLGIYYLSEGSVTLDTVRASIA